jgi:hypothetical protein
MFPRLRQRLSPALLDRIDSVIELGTLGEFGLAQDGLPLALDPQAADGEPRAVPAPQVRRGRDDCPFSPRCGG